MHFQTYYLLVMVLGEEEYEVWCNILFLRFNYLIGSGGEDSWQAHPKGRLHWISRQVEELRGEFEIKVRFNNSTFEQDPEENTWEPLDNLGEAEKAIKLFEKEQVVSVMKSFCESS